MVTKGIHSQTTIPKVPNTGFLEKLKIPVFTGDDLEYAEFKTLFTKIFKPLLLDDAIVMQYLRDSIPKDIRYVLEGAQTLDIIWSRLDEKYGKKINSVVLIIDRLFALDLSKGRHFEKIEKLAYAIDSAEHLLSSLDSKGRLDLDIRLVGQLIKKLPDHYQREWYDWAAKQTNVPEPGHTEWKCFRIG